MKNLIMLLIITSCSSTMVQNPNNRPKYAPKNYQQIGQIKYFNQGADWVISQRREDAFKQMHEQCGGDYEVIKEVNDSTATHVTGGPGMISAHKGDHYITIDFKCTGEPAKIASIQEEKIIACTTIKDCSDGKSCKDNKCQNLGIWGRLFNR